MRHLDWLLLVPEPNEEARGGASCGCASQSALFAVFGVVGLLRTPPALGEALRQLGALALRPGVALFSIVERVSPGRVGGAGGRVGRGFCGDGRDRANLLLGRLSVRGGPRSGFSGVHPLLQLLRQPPQVPPLAARHRLDSMPRSPVSGLRQPGTGLRDTTLYAARGLGSGGTFHPGMRSSCRILLRLSSSPQKYTNFPSSTRKKNTSSTSIRFPVGRSPKNSPRCVPEHRKRPTTVSPSATNSTISSRQSGKAE